MRQSLRLYLPELSLQTQQVILPSHLAHHVVTVLRGKPGDSVTLFNGHDGYLYTGTIEKIVKKNVTIHIDQYNQGPNTESKLSIHLIQAVGKKDKFDWVVQKATELGVKKITPIITDYTDYKLPAEKHAKKQHHWQEIAVQAAQQCQRLYIPTIDSIIPLTKWWEGGLQPNAEKLMMHPGQQTFKQVIENKVDILNWQLFVGPEGGFSPRECQQAQDYGVVSVGLGPRILRTETAPIAMMSALQMSQGDF